MTDLPWVPSNLRFGRRFFIAGAASLPVTRLVAAAPFAGRGVASTTERSVVDSEGVWRWPDGREVALFGVNYNLASASAYRFAVASGVPFDRIINQDFAHFARLGFNGLRLCLWADWENTDASGNLVTNEQLSVVDRIVARAGEAGIACLLSPIATYDASWPDALDRPRTGLSHAFDKAVLGTDARAIAAQHRYLNELLLRVNPLTGRRYADEPAIVAVEPINEPTHHSSDRAGSVRYINALEEAVRGAGFAGPIFYNYTQDVGIGPAIVDAGVEGATFAWYPTGLQNGRAVAGNGLLLVDGYEEFGDRVLQDRAKLVYEFDAADSMASYFYPAMVRAFRTGGAQLAAMFAYDSLAIAAANSEFNDHYLNLVYTPAKAVSARIAALAMQELPRGRDWGHYPESMRFGGFRVDDLDNLSLFVDDTRFFHSNDTDARPPAPSRLQQLAGFGSSLLVDYDGAGAWFLDRVEPGVWRLEVYPDAALVANPFVFRRPSRPATRIVTRPRRMRIDLPDLGRTFTVSAAGDERSDAVVGGAFTVLPGVYRLAKHATSVRVDPTFHAAPGETFDPVVLHEPPASRTAGKPWTVAIDVVAPAAPETVTMWVRGDRRPTAIAFSEGNRFRYTATVPAETMRAGFLDYYITIEGNGVRQVVPDAEGGWPADWDFARRGGFRVPVVADGAPLTLFDADRHGDAIVVPYGGYSASPSIGIAPGANGETVLRIDGSALASTVSGDLPAQRAWDGAIDDEGRDLSGFRNLRIRGRASTVDGVTVGIILIERDGMAWGAPVRLSPDADVAVAALTALRPVEAAMLPRDFPVGINPWMLRRPRGRGATADKLRLQSLQAIQVTIGSRFLSPGEQVDAVAEISSISLEV